jgi:probable HAF family extracellular repeat protein
MTSYTYTTIHDPLAVGPNDTIPVGINDAGQIIGWYQAGSDTYDGFLYSGGSYTTLDSPLGGGNNGRPLTLAFGINDAGQIVGYYTDGQGGFHAFLYSHGSYTTIEDPLGTSTDATGINNAGEIVGYYQNGSQVHGFTATPIHGVYVTQQPSSSVTQQSIAPLYTNQSNILGDGYSSGDGSQPFVDAHLHNRLVK